MGAANELLIKIRTIESLGGFDSLEGKVKKAATDMKGMENTTNAAAKKMKTDLEQVNNSNFSSLNSKFTSTIRSMSSTAASGAKAIKSSLEGMTDGINGAITSVASGMGVMELFEKSMGKSLTSTQLHNAKPNDYNSIMDQYLKFTTASSASDDDINKMLRYTYSGNSSSTYKAINAVDAISYNADKLQRQEGIRGWGTYLSGGWTAASGMMRDEPLTADQVKLLQNAKTYDQRIAAMETIAKQKGNLDDKGNSLSTTTDGTLGKYNKTLAFADSIMRGATSTFETFMTTIDPVITGFNNLDQGTKDIIGGLLTWGVLLTAGAAGLGILSRALSPVYNALNNLRTSSNKAVDASTDLVDGFDKSNKKISSSSSSFAGRMSKIAVKALAITAVSVALMGSINTVGGDTKTDLANAYDKIGDHKKAEEIRKGIPQPLKYGQAYDPNHTFKLPPQTQGTGTTEYSDKVPKNSTSVQAVSKSGLWDPSGILGLIGIKSPLDATQHMNQALDPFGINGWINSGINWLTNSNPDQNKANLPQGPNLFSPASAASSNLPPATTPSNATSLTSVTNPNAWHLPDISPQSILDTIKSTIPIFNWQIPNASDVLGQINQFIPQLPWHIPSSGEVLGWVNQHIPTLPWHIPGVGEVGGWIQRHIPSVPWHIPSLQSVYNMMKDAVWAYLTGSTGGDDPDQGLGQGPYVEKNTNTNLSDYVMPVTSTSNSTTKKETNYNVTVKVDTVDSDSRVDQIVRAVAIGLNNHNNANGN